MSMKLFVGGLSFTTDQESLTRAFQPFGEIQEATVINDRETGRSRGFGFVTFADSAAAGAAIQALDGQLIDGRNVRVNEAQERQPRASGGYGGGGAGGGGGASKGKSRRGSRDDRW